MGGITLFRDDELPLLPSFKDSSGPSAPLFFFSSFCAKEFSGDPWQDVHFFFEILLAHVVII